MESTEFLVSVIIPVYNGEAFLAEAISSVLRQNYEPMEIIIVDDGSTDGSAAIAKSYKNVRYIYQPNQQKLTNLYTRYDNPQHNLFPHTKLDKHIPHSCH